MPWGILSESNTTLINARSSGEYVKLENDDYLKIRLETDNGNYEILKEYNYPKKADNPSSSSSEKPSTSSTEITSSDNA